MTTPQAEDKLLDRVRKLLAQAEDPAVTEPERDAFMERATALMAKYGIDQALLAATAPQADEATSKIITVSNPWGGVKAHMLSGLAAAMRCQAVMLNGRDGSTRVHLFGFRPDLERTELLYTSLLLQMSHGLIRQDVPVTGGRARAWRRSWLLGFATAVIAKVRQAEGAAVRHADAGRPAGSPGVALVLADRSLAVQNALKATYPRTRTTRTTYSGSGYSDGHAAGQRADIGGTGLGRSTAGALR